MALAEVKIVSNGDHMGTYVEVEGKHVPMRGMTFSIDGMGEYAHVVLDVEAPYLKASGLMDLVVNVIEPETPDPTTA